MTHLISNPPKYELEDGSIQTWRGMPKLPDVVDVMLDLREKAVQDARNREADKEREEFAKLEKRRAEHPEEFMGMGDFVKRLWKEKPELAAKAGFDKPKLPNVRTIFPDIDPEKNREKLRQQAEKLNAKQEEINGSIF